MYGRAGQRFSSWGFWDSLAEKPLDDIANALGDRGRGEFADIYSTLHVDTPHHQVVLYVTDTTRAGEMIQAAKTAHPSIDASLIKVTKAAYTKKSIDAAIDKIMEPAVIKKAADLTIYTAAEAPDGSGIKVTAKSSALGSVSVLAMKETDGIPVTVTAGSPVHTDEWRWNDTTPFIGGDVLLGNDRKPGYASECTGGMAVEDMTGEDYLVTSAHCFPLGAGVYGDANPVGDLGSLGNYGNLIGTVHDLNASMWDDAIVDTGLANGQGTNSDEADSPDNRWIPVDSYAYSYFGQSVCQDGARSYYTGHGVPCGIEVVNDDVEWSETWDDGSVVTVRGVGGDADTWSSTEGDSGGLVFAVEGTNTRQARGIVEAGDANVVTYWTEAPDILNSFSTYGLHLNPHQ